jgi:hypothetical protein
MTRFVMIAAATLVIAGCAEQAPPTSPMSIPIFADARSDNASGGNFGTPMSGDEEVPPTGVVNTSNARGNAIFHLSADGETVEYKLIASNIENVFMAHIHRAPAGANGGIVLWLHPSTTPNVRDPVGGGRTDGILAQGTFTSANFVGALAGTSMAAFIADVKAGNLYVNVHTDDGVAPANTGPGDYPGGEIRGQIEHRGH